MEENNKLISVDTEPTEEFIQDIAETDNSEETDYSPENIPDREPEQAENPVDKLKKLTLDDIFKKAGQLLNDFGIIEMSLLRFIAVFFTFSGINILIQRTKDIRPVGNWREFIGEVNLTLTFVLMAVGFVVLTAVYKFIPEKFKVTDQSLAIFSVLFFDMSLLWKGESVHLSIGVMLVSIVFIHYALGKMKSKKLYNKIPWQVCGLIILIATVLVGIFLGVTTVCRHKNYGSSTHDFGLFVQMYHSLAKNLTAVTTCERDEFLSHFKVHASYIFYFLVPIYKMFPKPETLLIAQVVLTLGGIVPMFLIARNHKMKGLALIFMGFAYVFCIGIVGPCYYEFHENAFLPTLLMWLLWAVDKKNYVMFYIMSVLVCIVKEDAPLYVISIGMFMFYEDKKVKPYKRLHGVIMSLFALSYMIFITNWLIENGDGQMMTSTRFGLLMIDSSGGLGEVVKNVLSDPSYFFSLLIKEETVFFFLQIMLPMLFIPFFTKKIHRYLLMIPFIIMNLVVGAGYGYAANIGYQYLFGPVCLLLYLCIVNIEDMGQARKQEIPVLLGAAALIVTMGTESHFISYYTNHMLRKDYYDSLEVMLRGIPQDASVASDTWLVPHIADRDEVYILDNNDYDPETNTIVNVERYDFFVVPVGTELYINIKPLFEEYGIVLYDKVDDRIEVYKSPLYDLYK